MSIRKRAVGFVVLFLAITVASAQESTDADDWRSHTPEARYAFILAFEAGYSIGGNSMIEALSNRRLLKVGADEAYKKIADEMRIKAQPKTLSDGMMKLYEDPANAYVANYSALLIAWDRLRGKDVEKQLREARRFGFAIREELRKEKNR